MSKPTILWVHGAWHSPDYFHPLTFDLRHHGYSNTTVTLPSVGANPPHKDMSQDVAVVKNAITDILDNKGNNVVVVCHSYGGAVASNAAEGLAEKDRNADGKKTWIQAIVYVAAFALPKGMSLNGSLPEGFTPPFYNLKYDHYLYLHDPEKWMYHDVPEDIRRPYLDKLKNTYQSYKVLDSPVTYEAFRDIPCAYVLCTEDKAIPLESQEKMIQGAGITQVLRLNTSHTPFLTKSKEIASFVREIAGQAKQ